jgi:hypothetical protein
MANIRAALMALLRHTRDGERDFIGLSAVDTRFGWDISSKPTWSLEQEQKVKSMLRHYRNQLEDMGFCLEKLQSEVASKRDFTNIPVNTGRPEKVDNFAALAQAASIEISCRWDLRSDKAHRFIINGQVIWLGNHMFKFIEMDDNGICKIQITKQVARKKNLAELTQT